MSRVLAAQVGSYVNQIASAVLPEGSSGPAEGTTVQLQGWVHSLRLLGSNLAFLTLRDRSGMVQAVLEGPLARPIPVESVVTVEGKVVAVPRPPGGVEVRATACEVVSAADSPLPFEINKKELRTGLEALLDHRVIGLRHPRQHAIFTVQSALVGAFRTYLVEQGFTQIFTPKIVAMGTEGGSNLFPIQYFDQQAYLAQSPQFYKQMMVGAGYERVFEVGPVYRAEEHNTSRHLNEYTSLDVEMGFIGSEEELMDLETALLRSMFANVATTCESELGLWGAVPPDVVEIPRIAMTEAQGILERRFGKLSPKGDLDPEGERLLCQHVAETGKPGLVFITRYPRAVRPMYAMPAPEDESLTASFDLLFNGLEVTTGGQRIHQPALLIESMESRGLNPKSFAAYLELFRYGMPPHGGFAIGLERLTARLLGLANVREAAAFPRDRTRLTP